VTSGFSEVHWRLTVSEQNKRLVRRALKEVFAGGKLAAVDNIFHPDFVMRQGRARQPGRVTARASTQRA
jgi:hypothetical protein